MERGDIKTVEDIVLDTPTDLVEVICSDADRRILPVSRSYFIEVIQGKRSVWKARVKGHALIEYPRGGGDELILSILI